MGVEGNALPDRELLGRAVQELVRHALRDGRIIRSGPEAASLARRYPGAGLTTSEISEMLVRAALKAGVATELSQPE